MSETGTRIEDVAMLLALRTTLMVAYIIRQFANLTGRI